MAAMTIAVGVVLALIGIRFWLTPGPAERTFGLLRGSEPAALPQVVALRDLWLGLLVVALAWLREWRAVALWLMLGAFVCIGDAGIVIAAGGNGWATIFHAASGMVCAVLAFTAWRRASGLNLARRHE